MWSETVYVKFKEEGVNSLNMMNMRFILLNMKLGHEVCALGYEIYFHWSANWMIDLFSQLSSKYRPRKVV